MTASARFSPTLNICAHFESYRSSTQLARGPLNRSGRRYRPHKLEHAHIIAHTKAAHLFREGDGIRARASHS